MPFVYDHKNPPPPHSHDITENRSRRASVLEAVKSMHRPGVDDRLVELAAEAMRMEDEVEYLGNEDFSKSSRKLGERIKEIVARLWQIRAEMAKIRAISFAGLVAKSAVAQEVIDWEIDGEPVATDPANYMLETVTADIFRLCANASPSVAAESRAERENVQSVREKIEFLLERLTRIEGLTSALQFMSLETTYEIQRAGDRFRRAVEELADIQKETMGGMFDALSDVDDFVGAVAG